MTKVLFNRLLHAARMFGAMAIVACVIANAGVARASAEPVRVVATASEQMGVSDPVIDHGAAQTQCPNCAQVAAVLLPATSLSDQPVMSFAIVRPLTVRSERIAPSTPPPRAIFS